MNWSTFVIIRLFYLRNSSFGIEIKQYKQGISFCKMAETWLPFDGQVSNRLI